MAFNDNYTWSENDWHKMIAYTFQGVSPKFNDDSFIFEEPPELGQTPKPNAVRKPNKGKADKENTHYRFLDDYKNMLNSSKKLTSKLNTMQDK